MSNKELYYLFSMSLQISGGFLLVYMGFTKNVKNIAEEIAGFNFIGKDIESIEIPQIANKLLEIYLTRIGFILVFLGYVFLIFSDKGSISKGDTLFSIAVISLIIIFVMLLASHILINKRKEVIEKELKQNLPEDTIFMQVIE